MSDWKNTSICLPHDLHRKIKARAKAEGFENSLSAYLVKLIREEIAKTAAQANGK